MRQSPRTAWWNVASNENRFPWLKTYQLPVVSDVFQQEVPVLPLRDVVVYPHMVIPLFVGRDKSIRALDGAMATDKQILLIAQKSADVDDPRVKDLYEIGTLANILQLLKLPDGTVKVLVEGSQRARIDRFLTTEDAFSAPHRARCPKRWRWTSASRKC
jgi:ATP-dependent Lon protease